MVYAPIDVMPHHPTGDMWGFDLINMQISHVWGTSYEQIPLLLRAANDDHFQFLTDLHSDITEKLIFLLKNKNPPIIPHHGPRGA